jgi:hypothetical protein
MDTSRMESIVLHRGDSNPNGLLGHEIPVTIRQLYYRLVSVRSSHILPPTISGFRNSLRRLINRAIVAAVTRRPVRPLKIICEEAEQKIGRQRR